MQRIAAANLSVSHLQCLLPFIHQCSFLIILVLPKVSEVDHVLPFSSRDESIKASPFLDDLKSSIYMIFCNIFSGISELYGVPGVPLLQQWEKATRLSEFLYFCVCMCVYALVPSSLTEWLCTVNYGRCQHACFSLHSTQTHTQTS